MAALPLTQKGVDINLPAETKKTHRRHARRQPDRARRTRPTSGSRSTSRTSRCSELETRLRNIFDQRKDKTMFIIGGGYAALQGHRRRHRRGEGRRRREGRHRHRRHAQSRRRARRIELANSTRQNRDQKRIAAAGLPEARRFFLSGGACTCMAPGSQIPWMPPMSAPSRRHQPDAADRRAARAARDLHGRAAADSAGHRQPVAAADATARAAPTGDQIVVECGATARSPSTTRRSPDHDSRRACGRSTAAGTTRRCSSPARRRCATRRSSASIDAAKGAGVDRVGIITEAQRQAVVERLERERIENEVRRARLAARNTAEKTMPASGADRRCRSTSPARRAPAADTATS